MPISSIMERINPYSGQTSFFPDFLGEIMLGKLNAIQKLDYDNTTISKFKTWSTILYLI